MKRFVTICMLCVCGLFLSEEPALAQTSTLAPDLQNLDPSSKVNVIIQFNLPPGVLQLLQITGLGGIVIAPLNAIGGLLVSLPAPLVRLVAALPIVKYVSPDRSLGATLDNSTAAVNAAAAWQSGWDGSGISIAVIDSGVAAHPDLAGRIVYQEDFTGSDTADRYGHGTHIAGIAAGNGKNSTCPTCTRLFKGVAPGASIVSLRVLDQNGNGKDSAVIKAIGRAIQLQRIYNIRVINLSLGHPVVDSYTNDPLCQAVEAAWRAGIVVVVAAGNDGRNNSAGTSGYGTIGSPGNDPYVITVGAMKTEGTPQRGDDLIASYSSKGPTAVDHIVKPDLVAPGNRVVSLMAPGSTLAAQFPGNLVPLSYYQSGVAANVSSTSYFTLSGTSMATPVVSGAAADLLEAHPSLTPDQVKAILMKSAYKAFPATSVAVDPSTGVAYSSQYDAFTTGAGYLDLGAALNTTAPLLGTSQSPVASYSSGAADARMNPGLFSAWNLLPAWSANNVWGSLVLFPNGLFWGNSAPWGATGSPGFTVIWGGRSPWISSDDGGTKSHWGTQTSAGTKCAWGTDEGAGEN